MIIKVDELEAAAAAADQGPPVPLWAVLLELAGVASLETLPAPERVEIYRNREVAVREPVLVLDFRRADDAIAWCDWFGTDHHRVASTSSLDLSAVASTRRRVWRGYSIQVSSRSGPRR